MSQQNVLGSRSARPWFAGGSRGVVRWVCTQNPFYVLSALLVCVGLWVSFGSQVHAAQSWALLLGLAGYTLLLAVTACLLVRFVGVWDDVRTVLLLAVLMFLATSVTFDEVLAHDPGRGLACYLVGLFCAVAISEGMLRGIRLALPPLFRGPYYLALCLFFLYPAAISPLVDSPRSEALQWALYGFSPAAGLVVLSLIPAARRGRDYVRHSGSPWPWAWYPWTLFGVLAFGVVARSALLAWSMHHVPLQGGEPYIFGGYFLVPFLLAVAVLLLELGLVEGCRGPVRVALGLVALLPVLATIGHRPDAFYQDFLAHFSARLGGTPLYLSLLSAAAFYGYAAVRRVPLALGALAAATAALAVVAPSTLDLGGLVAPRPLPIAAVGLLEFSLGLHRRETRRVLVGALGLAASAAIALPGTGLDFPRGPAAFHLIMLAVLGVGWVCDDSLGRVLRATGAAMAVAGCLAVMTSDLGQESRVPVWLLEAYPLIMIAMLAIYGLWLADGASMACASLIAMLWMLAAAWHGYCAVRRLAPGLDFIAVGLVLFSLAVVTSMAKGGVLPWQAGVNRRKAARPPIEEREPA